MKTIVGYPGTGFFAQQIARALHEHNALLSFFTTFTYRDDGATAALLASMPGHFGKKLHRQFMRRSANEIPLDKIETQPFWEIVRTFASKGGASAPIVDRIWDRMAHNFTQALARRMTPPCEALYAYEYTALEAFRVAGDRNIVRILDLPSLSSHHFEAVKQRELAQFPELQDFDVQYFKAKFARRQARRDEEIATADVIMTNSKLTARSHIRRGADPNRVFTVPLAAPQTIDQITMEPSAPKPLKVIWAGNLSVGKGAHYFLNAWQFFRSDSNITGQIYGASTLPECMMRNLPENLTFVGSVSQGELFEAFEAGDVLMFPTLSDGFGMVITEAFARGLPVITTDQAGAADFVAHETNGLIIRSGDNEAIKDALSWCLDNRGKLWEMRDAALQTAKGWQWSDYRQQLVATLDGGIRQAGFESSFGSKLEFDL